MAHYQQKYRKAMKDVRKWMADDSLSDELHEANFDRIHGGVDTADSDGEDVAECSGVVHKRCHALENVDIDGSGFISDNEQLSSSGDEQHSLDFDSIGTLQEDLAEFMVTEHLSRNACNRLLGLLRKHGHSGLPKDSRTLRRTPRIVEVVVSSYLHNSCKARV